MWKHQRFTAWPKNVVRLAQQTATLLALGLLAACGVADNITGPRPHATVLAPPPHYPIIFVHGFNANSTTWTTMVGRFKAEGWADRELVDWSYNYNQSNATTAQQIGAKVDSVMAATGAHHVDIIAHSMGSLSARYYARNLITGSDTSTKIDALVSLGGPNHGTTTAFGCTPISCVEMRPYPYGTFTTKLNASDETWGAPRYATWWSSCDEVIYPQKSVILNGATNTQTACLRHSQLHEDYTVYTQVRNWVKQTRYGL